MKTPAHTFKAATLGIFLLAVGVLTSCGRPPDDVLKQGVGASAQMETTRKLPFAVTGESMLKDYKIKNSYKKDDAHIYEYEATVVVKGGWGNPTPSGHEVTVQGKVRVQKVGNRWESKPQF